MKFEIKHRWSGEILFSVEAENWRFAVEAAIKAEANLSKADLSKADLSWANLSWANLSEANLSEANLSEADLSWANLSEANLSEADLSWANLSWANLSEANLSKADLSWANLSEANLSWADLSKANLSAIRNDFWAVLLYAPNEVRFLRQALVTGNVDGSSYEGDCACLVGTLANAKKCAFNSIPGLRPDSYRPAERFFMGIKEGDTPETNPCSKLAIQWLDEWVERLGFEKEATLS